MKEMTDVYIPCKHYENDVIQEVTEDSESVVQEEVISSEQ